MAEKANTLEYLYYKIRTGNPNNPALKQIFPQLDLDAQKRVQADTSTVNKEADKMHDVEYNPKVKGKVGPARRSSARHFMMDKSRVDL